MGETDSIAPDIVFCCAKRVRLSLLCPVLFLVITLYMASGSCVFAEETDVDPGPPDSDEQPTDQETHETSSDEESASMANTVLSMFQEKESPLLHVRWGTKVFVDVPLGNEPTGADLTLRKAELKLSRAFGKHFQAKVSANYLKGEFKAGDSYLVYTGWKKAILTGGVQSPPFSLEAGSSSSAISFMESPLPVAALAENKNAGLDFLRRTSNHILNASWVFYNPRQEGVSETGQAVVARYVYSPLSFHGRENFHLGGSFSYRFLNSGAEVQMRSRPEVATSNIYYVDTGNIDDGKSIVRMGLEASQIRGRFSWQSEVLAARVIKHQGDTHEFWGAYVHLSQFLTHDSRNYDQGSGTFVNVIPNNPLGKSGWGAFELAFRASYVDLTDKDIIGGEESNISLGLNWYLNEKLRVMANAIKVLDVDRPGNEYDGENPFIFALRAQWLIY